MLTTAQSKPTTIFCQHCQNRDNNKKHDTSGHCSALDIFVMRKDKRANTCNRFLLRPGAKIFDAPVEEPPPL